ncbi:GAF domain-containing protein [Noviherbaspirillum galbum]|uniref:GAF domain-containing protein n=1 Tax=Noviherbaspirillum galbum TaxID=2709383 RepID=A0A6B3SXB1_9BURK|nr:GAF domain-containing protein [Noviherbaspirillum galbum]NEX63746.1 GAF domain-containing protein [Noviherbaspirillum galbum]
MNETIIELRLEDVVITHELLHRPRQGTYPLDLTPSFRLITAHASLGDYSVLRATCLAVLALCKCGSAGFSRLGLLDEDLRWDVVTGVFERYEGGASARFDSPCGYTIDRNSAQLFERPARYFNWMEKGEMTVFEGLVVPLHYPGTIRPYGVIWALTHDLEKRFSIDDLRIMSLLTAHAATLITD